MKTRKIETQNIRNFSIIAHIDHGKSTLADRFLELTGVVSERDRKEQILDNMELEREKGITIKSQTVRLDYLAKDGKHYVLNLIDTPGHVDFSYEVSRALAACEGALLIVDATQGVQAQTFAHMVQAMEQNLTILPVINKIDLKTANLSQTQKEIEKELGLDPELIVCISAKEGIAIDLLLESIVRHIPAPYSSSTKGLDHVVPPKALIFDAYFDFFRGVVLRLRVFEGEFRVGDRIRLFQSDLEFKIEEMGIYRIQNIPQNSLGEGEVGYIIANIKDLSQVKIGDTITLAELPCKEPLAGYKEIIPMVFAGIYPLDAHDYEALKKAFGQLKLNDASLTYETETSIGLGFGFRCGFLGLLHMEIIQERIRREFQLDLIASFPSVPYVVTYKNGERKHIENPSLFPDSNWIESVEEPYVRVEIFSLKNSLGRLIQIIHEKRGIQKNLQYPDSKRVILNLEMPLSEIIYDFHDRIKSASQGYASYDYEMIGYRVSSLIRMDILIHHKRVEAFSQILHRDQAYVRGKAMVEKLKEVIPSHLFQVPLQAAIGNKILARETIRAIRKDVTAKCYGGDISRKRKLLEKQKEGKKRMKQLGEIQIPQEAFLSILKI